MSVFKATDSGLRCAEVFPNQMSLSNLSHDMSPDDTPVVADGFFVRRSAANASIAPDWRRVAALASSPILALQINIFCCSLELFQHS